MADKTFYGEAILGRSWWQPIALGIVLIVAGLIMLRHAMVAKALTAKIFGVVMLGAGLSEMIDSFWTPNWSAFSWRMLVGTLYSLGGTAMIADPLAASVMLTLVFALAMFASGVVRMWLAIQEWHLLNALLFTSGLVGVLAAFLLVAKWPLTGLSTFGLMIGIDLVLHGVWWVLLGWTARYQPRSA